MKKFVCFLIAFAIYGGVQVNAEIHSDEVLQVPIESLYGIQRA